MAPLPVFVFLLHVLPYGDISTERANSHHLEIIESILQCDVPRQPKAVDQCLIINHITNVLPAERPETMPSTK